MKLQLSVVLTICTFYATFANNIIGVNVEKFTGEFYADPLEAALRKDVSDLFDKVKADVDQWIKVGPKVVKDNAQKVTDLLKIFKDKTAPDKIPIPDATPKGKDFISCISDLINDLVISANAIFDKLKTDPSGQSIKSEDEKKALQDLLSTVYKNAIEKFHSIPTDDKLGQVRKSLNYVMDIDKAIVTNLYPKTTAERTLYYGVEKIIKQVEALMAMEIKALGG